MDKVNNVRPASQVGRSLSPIETPILILIGAFILMRITKKFLNRINPRPADISVVNVRQSFLSTSTGSTGGDQNADRQDSDTPNNRVDESSSSTSTSSTDEAENEGSKAGEDVKDESVEEKQNYNWVHCDGKLMRVKTAPNGQDSGESTDGYNQGFTSSSTSSTDGEEFKDFEVGDVVTDKSENDPFVYVIQAIEETTSQCTLYDGIEIHPGKPLNMMEKMKTAPDEVAINEGKVYRLTDNICALTSSYVNKDYKVNEEILVKEDLKKGFVKSNRGFIFPKKMLIPLNP